jgi:hypothetical protein
MMHFAAQKEEFRGWPESKRRTLLDHLLQAVSRAGVIPIGSVVSLDGYRALPAKERARLKDPHFVAFQTLTYQIAAAAGIQLETGPVTMVYAHHPEHSDGLGNTRKLWEAVRTHHPMIQQFMESYVCSEQTGQPGLQAADLWAYELRHHFQVIRPAARPARWPFQQLVKLGLNYEFTNDFITYHDENGVTGLGRMSRVQRWGEIDLYKPGFVGVHPRVSRRLAIALRRFANQSLKPINPEINQTF